jgi:hypothetical protein
VKEEDGSPSKVHRRKAKEGGGGVPETCLALKLRSRQAAQNNLRKYADRRADVCIL